MTDRAPYRYRLVARANLRHFLPDAREEGLVESATPLSAAAIVERAGVPRGEVMLLLVDGRPLLDDEIPPDGATVELLPVMSGG